MFIQQILLEKLLSWIFAYCLFALFPPFIELLGISAGWKPANYFSRPPVSWLLVRFCQWEAKIVWKTKRKRKPDPFPFSAAGDASQSGSAWRLGGAPVQAMSILTAEAAVPPMGVALVYALVFVSSLVTHFQNVRAGVSTGSESSSFLLFWVILLSVLFFFFFQQNQLSSPSPYSSNSLIMRSCH